MKKQLQRNPALATLGVFVLLYGLAALRYDGFFSIRVAANLFTDNSFLGVAALGMTVVILSRGIDLSVGSVVGFTTVFVAYLIETAGVSTPLALLMALAAGALFGAGMGLLIVVYELPAFLVTLGGLFFAKGMGFVVSQRSTTIADPMFAAMLDFNIELSRGAYIGVGALVFVVYFLLVCYGLRWTRSGRYVYAVGGSEDSARLMGLPVDRVKVGVYAFSGFSAALAGILNALYISGGNPLAGVGMELDAIAAVVVGGTLLTGGVGGAVGTLLGALIFGVIQTMMNFQGNIDPAWRRISIASLLLVFILSQRFLLQRSRRG